MPYGIQQPAVSGQILQLERALDLKLFERRPFVLTPAGRELLAFVEPFFGQINDVSRRLRSEEMLRLRLAAPATILRDHLPDLLKHHKKKYPGLILRLRDANQAMAEALLQKQQIDIAVTELDGQKATAPKSAVLFNLPLVLVAPVEMKIRNVSDFFLEGAERPPLISLPPEEVLVKQFHRGLRRKGVNWPTHIEVSSIDLIPRYVELGLGVGLSLQIPGNKIKAGLRILPLREFPPLVIVAMWQRHLSQANADFLAEIRRRAQMLEGS